MPVTPTPGGGSLCQVGAGGPHSRGGGARIRWVSHCASTPLSRHGHRASTLRETRGHILYEISALPRAAGSPRAPRPTRVRDYAEWLKEDGLNGVICRGKRQDGGPGAGSVRTGVKAFLLAAASGEGCGPSPTFTEGMLEIGGRPLLGIWLDETRQVGADDVLVNTHHLPTRAAVRGSAHRRARIRLSHEPELLGSEARGGAIAKGEDRKFLPVPPKT